MMSDSVENDPQPSRPTAESSDTPAVGNSSSPERASDSRTVSDPVTLDDPPATSVATLQLPGAFADGSVDNDETDGSSTGRTDSIHLPLLDSSEADAIPPLMAGAAVSLALGPRPILKGYEILAELGRGGMGVVYKANQQGLNRLVAIKMVLGGDHAREEDLARFKIEAEAVASIQHPNIVQIYEVGDKDGTPYFSLEFIDGGTLHQRIDGKPQKPESVAEIAHQLALAMRHFHERGVIHRDLKPANVLMTLQGSPKITDFGLAKRLEGNSSQTRTGSLMGTPSYMAPEQASGNTHEIGPLSDLYSLGAIIYEMLTGRPPFQGATMLDTIDQVRSQEPVPPRRLQPKIPRDLETISLKCLQKEPAKRYPTAGDLAADLERFLIGEPIKARPVSRLEHGWRWVRRNPRIALLSTSLIVVGLVMIGLAGITAVKNTREAQTINDARLFATDRLDRASKTIADGHVRRAIEIIGVPDPYIERTVALTDIRDKLRKLRAQILTFDEFQRLLDQARYLGLPGNSRHTARSRQAFQEVRKLYDEIENHKGRGEFGLPPLSDWQQQLYKEDVFDAFLVAAQDEYDRPESRNDKATRMEAARQAVLLLDRVEKLLPPTRVFYTHRQLFKKTLGDEAGYQSDKAIGQSINPNSPVDLFWRGFADKSRADELTQKKQEPQAREFYGLARDQFARFLQARPESYWGHLEWAGCHFRLGNYYDAMVGYSKCVQLRNEGPLAYHNRAEAYALVKDFDAAILDETRAISYDPQFIGAYIGRATANQSLGKLTNAIADFDLAIRLDPTRAELKFQRGLLEFNVRRFAAALNDFDDCVKAFPKLAGPYRLRAQTRFALHDFEGSLADWSRVISLIPVDHEYRYYQGIYQMGLRHYDEALKQFDLSLELAPGYMLPRLAKARIFHWRGEDGPALEMINEVVARFDASSWDSATKAAYLNDRVDLYRNLGRLEESVADAERSIELNPSQIDAYLALVMLEQHQGKPETEIIALYNRMLQANPESVDAHLRAAEYYRDRGHFELALAEIQKARAFETDPLHALSRLCLAGVQAARGDGDDATTEADAILKAVPHEEGPMVYAAASVWSLASGVAAKRGDAGKAKFCNGRATALLQRSLTECYHDFSYQEQERIALDPALDPIRNDPEVQRLLSFRP